MARRGAGLLSHGRNKARQRYSPGLIVAEYMRLGFTELHGHVMCIQYVHCPVSRPDHWCDWGVQHATGASIILDSFYPVSDICTIRRERGEGRMHCFGSYQTLARIRLVLSAAVTLAQLEKYIFERREIWFTKSTK